MQSRSPSPMARSDSPQLKWAGPIPLQPYGSDIKVLMTHRSKDFPAIQTGYGFE
jgi:hypothetical protein